ncbi:MAG: DUF6577 family protein [Dysosmobacter sp.]
MAGGTAIGIIIGCLPGLSAAMGVALLLPMTFTMAPETGLIVLGAIHCGAIFGGSISAILIHTPGTPASAATAIEGYSDLATSVAGKIRETYPELDFRIFELVQLNEFVNHQIAHNAVFIFVEGDLGEYVFDTLKEEYAGHILLNPNADMYHQYWADDMLVIKKLITEAPKGTDEFWHTDLEKMLVDIVSDKLLRSCVNQGEYKTIFTQAFKDFYIDESQLFRYARRRNAKAKVLEQIDKSLLRTE